MRMRSAIVVLAACLAACAQQAARPPAREQAATRVPVDPVLVAAGFMQQHKFDEAKEVLLRFTASTPSGWQAVVDRGDRVDIAYWDSEQMLACSLADAKRLGKNVTWIIPSYSRAWYLLAFIAVEHGNYADANSAIDSGLALDPDQPTLLNEKATIVQQLGRHDEAVAWNRKVVENKRCATTEQLSRAWRSQAVSLTELGRLDDAEHALDESLKVDPGNSNTEREFIYIQQLRAKKPKVPVTVHEVH
jgi:Tfp pilus assembly protein PilF